MQWFCRVLVVVGVVFAFLAARKRPFYDTGFTSDFRSEGEERFHTYLQCLRAEIIRMGGYRELRTGGGRLWDWRRELLTKSERAQRGIGDFLFASYALAMGSTFIAAYVGHRLEPLNDGLLFVAVLMPVVWLWRRSPRTATTQGFIKGYEAAVEEMQREEPRRVRELFEENLRRANNGAEFPERANSQ